MKRSAFVAGVAAATTGPLGAQTREPYKIGMTFALTGPLVTLVGDSRIGAEVAAADVNRAGGVKGHPVDLVFEDSQGTAEGGVAAMRRLVQVEGVKAIVTSFTNVTVAQLPLADQLNVPLVSTTETPGLFGRSRDSFAHAETYATLLPILSDYWKKRGYKRIYSLFSNNATGKLMEPASREAVGAAGADFTDALVDLGQGDYRGVAAKVKDANPDAIFIVFQGAEAPMIRTLRELNVTVPVFIQGNFFYDPNWRAGVGPYVDGVIFAGLNVDPKSPFVREFKQRTGRVPGYVAGEHYDIIKMYAAAMAAGGYDAQRIRDRLATLKGVPSVFGGTITMGADHYTTPGSETLWRADHGRLVRV